VIATLHIAVPGSNALTAVISGALLRMDGILGFRGWRWLYMVEAAPAVLLAFAVLALMTDRPAKAKWLAPDERRWLEGTMESERQSKDGTHGHFTLRQALTDERVLTLSSIDFTIATATYGITFFLPTIKSLKFPDWETGLPTAIPYVIGTIGLLLWSRSSDERNERRWHFVVGAAAAAVGLAAAGPLLGGLPSLLAISFAAIGPYGTGPAFWPLPSEFLTGPAVAGGIALISSIGDLGGFVGPYVLGYLKGSTGGFEAGLYFLAVMALLSGVIALFAVRPAAQAMSPNLAKDGSPGSQPIQRNT
jgi:MFS transporter, ACS family, tartrate transporter